MEYLLQPCAICKHVPTMKEHHDADGLRAIYIDCPGCHTHGPFIHVQLIDHKERIKEICSLEWNNRQLVLEGVLT